MSEVHKGFRVFKMDEKDQSEFCEFRLTLESQALRSSYKNNRLELVRKLKNIIKEMKGCIKENNFEKHNLSDTKFHKSFFNLASNRYLAKHYDNIISVIETLRTNSCPPLSEAKINYSALKGHISIHEAIEAKNLTLALHELESHINSWYGDRIIKSQITSNRN